MMIFIIHYPQQWRKSKSLRLPQLVLVLELAVEAAG
jgi:hypothetical protein